jgi:hypothetical protein
VSYEGFGLYNSPKRRNGAMIAVVVAAVVVIGAAATLLFVGVRTTTPGQALPVAATTASRPKDPLQPQSTGAPVVPGWKVIPINNGGQLDTDKAYDVPQAWEALPRLATFGNAGSTSIVAPAIYMRGFCASDARAWRSMAGLMVARDMGDLGHSAAIAAQQIADDVFTTPERVKPKVDISDPQSVTVDRDKTGSVVTARVTIAPSEQDKCNTTLSALVVVMTLPTTAEEGLPAMVAFGDQNFPGASSEQELKQIVTSFHLVR